jgi:hypothetical protein
MPPVDNHQVDTPDTPTTSRRQLLTALLAGSAVVAATPLMAGRASAEGAEVGPANDPRDNAALNAAYERETRMAATYAIAVANTSNKDDKAALLVIHDHHVGYAQVIKGYLATNAKSPNGAPLASPSGAFAPMASQLASLENQTVEIHTGILANLIGLNAATLIASIITVEARQAAALTFVSGSTPLAAAGL